MVNFFRTDPMLKGQFDEVVRREGLALQRRQGGVLHRPGDAPNRGRQVGSEASIHGEAGEVVGEYVRMYNVTDEIKTICRDALCEDITADDIFHCVHGKLHDRSYRETYAANLEKMLPHIKTPESRKKFDKFIKAGTERMAQHESYENVEPWPLNIRVRAGVDGSNHESWRVLKMR